MSCYFSTDSTSLPQQRDSYSASRRQCFPVVLLSVVSVCDFNKHVMVIEMCVCVCFTVSRLYKNVVMFSAWHPPSGKQLVLRCWVRNAVRSAVFHNRKLVWFLFITSLAQLLLCQSSPNTDWLRRPRHGWCHRRPLAFCVKPRNVVKWWWPFWKVRRLKNEEEGWDGFPYNVTHSILKL